MCSRATVIISCYVIDKVGRILAFVVFDINCKDFDSERIFRRMAASPWAKSRPMGIFEFGAPAMFPRLRMGPATSFTTTFVPFFFLAVPQPPFSTKKVRLACGGY